MTFDVVAVAVAIAVEVVGSDVDADTGVDEVDAGADADADADIDDDIGGIGVAYEYANAAFWKNREIPLRTGVDAREVAVACRTNSGDDFRSVTVICTDASSFAPR